MEERKNINIDENKIKEAIDFNKDFLLNLETQLKYMEKNKESEILINVYKEQIESTKIVIEALKKQLPKKPTQYGVTVDGVFHPMNGIDGVPYDLCPNCEMDLCTEGIFAKDKRWVKYCNNCGQRLYW